MERRLLLLVLFLIAPLAVFCQSPERIKISSITPSENTGQDYTPWLNDDLNSLVEFVWSGNFKWVDVTLKLEKRSKITKVSLYDHQGSFESTPVSVYALDGTTKTLLGTFNGTAYMSFVDIVVKTPLDADAIIIHKYANAIPQKVQVYGTAATTAATKPAEPVVTTPEPAVVVTPTPAPVVSTVVAPERIKISSITPSENTGQDYTPWLNDDLNNLVEFVWSGNFKWVDVTLKLEKRSKITKVSLYDHQGSFEDTPVSVYALDGTTKTLLGTFNGTAYMSFVDIVVKTPLDADAIIIHKYANAIPQKVQVYGTAATTAATKPSEPVVTTPEPAVTIPEPVVVVTPTPAPVVSTVVAPERVKIAKISANENTGQNYTPWLNDDLNNLVEYVWTGNSKWVDVRLTFEKRSKITKVSLYDYEGTFADNPVSVYALDGANKIFLGLFEGLAYKTFVDIIVATPFDADAIVIHKFANNIPQKVQVFGLEATSVSTGLVDDSPVVTTPTPAPPVVVPPAPVIAGTKIEINPKRWYQLNNNNNGLEQLFDGILDASVNTGWGKILDNYDAYYPLLDDEQMTLQSIRFYDGQGIFQDKPMTLSVITDTWERIQIAKFTGDLYNAWVGPDPLNPNTFSLSNIPAGKIRYLVINTYGNLPTEMEFYGTHIASKKAVTAAPLKAIKMKDGFGVNGFEWDFFDPYHPDYVDETKVKAIKSFSGFRHYIDWDKLEFSENKYTFNPTYSGGWNYDAIYERCKTEGIEVLACIQVASTWLVKTYPESIQDYNVIPVKYGKSITDPASYIEQARVAFQYAARYGSNKNVDQSLLSVYDKPRWTFDNINTVKVGLGVVKYMECGNERDKWWKGRGAYQTAREHAANLSAFYDGHKNTMGPGVGVKNADPNMKVVMAGLAFAKTDYVRGMIDWCKEFRGYNADGTVNLCWDIINYHQYSDNSGSKQDGTSSRGAAPEVSEAAKTAKEFVQMAHDYANDMPVWITELGFDLNQGSPLKAIPIGNKSEYVTQADWGLRSSLMYNRLGVEKSFFYEIYDDNFENPIQFGSSGLIGPNQKRRPIADYLYQTNKLMGNYVYKETISQEPMVDRYEYNGKSAYVLFIADEKGRTTDYTLNLSNVSKANLYNLKVGADSMSVSSLAANGGKFTLNVTETPIFLIPTETASTNQAGNVKPTSNVIPTTEMNSRIAVSEKSGPETPLLGSLNTYPNPTTDYVLLTLDNESTENLEVKISDLTFGRVMLQNVFEKSGSKFSEKLDIRNLPAGNYVIEVIQGKEQMVKKIVKAG
ncbi:MULTISPECIES: T9SS type A sorting domain-containing protein [unclassified Arcicella]|uniref:T9SS type A sorting domain-containing protein n=1 Tax=unclassified Arcicella TaxID=2644986 RepID=UPI002860CABE|nr:MULTISPECIES: T9SS type A sorting domain-containing protein [unclassified Arcicella]MDR6564564.1 hypothetical protein [Arcicella sp. BE51]MDR6825726.1 hypothetical protein [Arcicella sp. BE139]